MRDQVPDGAQSDTETPRTPEMEAAWTGAIFHIPLRNLAHFIPAFFPYNQIDVRDSPHAAKWAVA